MMYSFHQLILMVRNDHSKFPRTRFVSHFHTEKPSKKFLNSSLRKNPLLRLNPEFTELIGLVALDQIFLKHLLKKSEEFFKEIII